MIRAANSPPAATWRWRAFYCDIQTRSTTTNLPAARELVNDHGAIRSRVRMLCWREVMSPCARFWAPPKQIDLIGQLQERAEQKTAIVDWRADV